MKTIKIFSSLLILAIIATACNGPQNQDQEKPAKVELIKKEGQYQLLKDGEIFFIKGAGLEYGNMESLKKHGGNSFRTWRVNNGQKSGKEVLDEAQRLGLMVCMGIEIERERHGFDYDDPKAVQEQFDSVKSEVMELKNHPALLMWGIGNELNLRYENKGVWTAVNDISKMIHEYDGNHPTTTMLAGAGKDEIESVLEYAPDLDLISFQMYGDIVNLPKYLMDANYKGAYIVSEWGATGHWEVEQTSWDRPIENNSSEKAKDYLYRYENVIASDPSQCIGSFVFLWGQKQERTPTWYGVFLENGNETEAVHVMHYVWNGVWPANTAPHINGLFIEGKTAYESLVLIDGENYTALADILDKEGDEIIYTWEIIPEVPRAQESDGGDVENRPQSVMSKTGEGISNTINFAAPKSGEYRLFVYADDGNGNTATANIPFLVEEK